MAITKATASSVAPAAAGDLVYGSGTNDAAVLALGTAGQVLKVNSGATAPEWGAAPTPLTTKGDLYTRDASADTRLPVGSNGQFLSANSSTSTGLQWVTAAGGMTSLASGTFSGASVTITSIAGTYNNLVLHIRNFRPATDGANLEMRFNADAGGNSYAYKTSGVDGSLTYGSSSIGRLQSASDNGTTISTAEITIVDYANTTTHKMANYRSLTTDQSTPTDIQVIAAGIGAWNNTNAITSITLLPSTGNFTSGSYILYGVK